MRKHVKILGWLQIALGVFDLLMGALALGLLSSMGALTGEAESMVVMTAMGGIAFTIMGVLALPNLICGIGLLRNWGGWVLVLAVILGVFNLAQAPIGTAIAIYSFWIAWKIFGGQPDIDES